MLLNKNDVVIIKPFEQIPDYKDINMAVYNKYKGKLLKVINREVYPDTKIYYTYCTMDSYENKFIGGDEIVIKFEEGL